MINKMGQKVNPIGLRVGYIRTWESNWLSKKNYTNFLHEDLKIREYLKKELDYALIEKILIERYGQKMRIHIYTGRAGIVIGRGGQGIERFRKVIQGMTTHQIQIDIHEVANTELSAQLIAENIAQQISKRMPFRRVMKQAMTTAMRHGAKGIKVACSGRLGGAEIARREWYREGRIPLHTLRADIDYGFRESITLFGRIGIKVWVFKGEVFLKEKANKEVTLSQK